MYTNLAKLILLELLELSNAANKQQCKLENHIFNIIYELQIPKSNTNIKACPTKTPFVIARPDLKKELDTCHVNIFDVITLLGGVKNWLNLITAILLEKYIIIRSEFEESIFQIVHAIECCIQPFDWNFPVFFPLPPFGPKPSAAAFYDSPIIHIAGFVTSKGKNKKNEGQSRGRTFSFASHSITEESDLISKSASKCVVDLVTKTVNIGWDFNSKQHKDSKILPCYVILEKHINQAIKSFEKSMQSQNQNLNAQLNALHASPSSNGMDDLHGNSLPSTCLKSFLTFEDICHARFNVIIREIHFTLLISLFHNYEKFCLGQTSNTSNTNLKKSVSAQESLAGQDLIVTAGGSVYHETNHAGDDLNNEEDFYKSYSYKRFESKSFLADQPPHYRKFLQEFVETHMFLHFTDDKMRVRRNSSASLGSLGAQHNLLNNKQHHIKLQISNSNSRDNLTSTANNSGMGSANPTCNHVPASQMPICNFSETESIDSFQTSSSLNSNLNNSLDNLAVHPKTNTQKISQPNPEKNSLKIQKSDPASSLNHSHEKLDTSSVSESSCHYSAQVMTPNSCKPVSLNESWPIYRQLFDDRCRLYKYHMQNSKIVNTKDKMRFERLDLLSNSSEENLRLISKYMYPKNNFFRNPP